MLRSHSHSHTPKASWVHQLPTCRRLHFLSVFLFFSKLELKSIKLIIKSFAMRLRFAFAHTFTAFCFCLICFCSHLLYVRACVDMYAWVCPPVCVCVFYSVHVCVYLSLCAFQVELFLLSAFGIRFSTVLLSALSFSLCFQLLWFFILLFCFILNSSNWHFLFNFTLYFSGLKKFKQTHNTYAYIYAPTHTHTQIE